MIPGRTAFTSGIAAKSASPASRPAELAACTSGGVEDQFAKALSDVNKDWELYEIAENRGAMVIKVEVSEIVSFKDGKKAVEAIQKGASYFLSKPCGAEELVLTVKQALA